MAMGALVCQALLYAVQEKLVIWTSRRRFRSRKVLSNAGSAHFFLQKREMDGLFQEAGPHLLRTEHGACHVETQLLASLKYPKIVNALLSMPFQSEMKEELCDRKKSA